MKLDCYTHIFPVDFFHRMEEVVENKAPIKRWLNIPMLYDVDARLRIMDTFGDYQQILTLSAPPIEAMAGPDITPGLARMANDGMHDLVKKYPDRFPAFIASLPMNNPEESYKELDRAVTELDARGIQIFSNVNGEPLDQDKYWPIFEKMAGYDLPIWLHPARGEDTADYKTESTSPYEIWWVLGWPYETSGAAGVLADFRAAAEHQDHHPSYGRDDPLFRRPCRAGLGSDGRSPGERGLCRVEVPAQKTPD